MTNWFITGISRGLGKALAEAALARGDTVIGTVRSGTPDVVEAPGTLHVLPLDMVDAKAIDATVARAFALAEQIDVVVNNAGYGLIGAIEDASDAEAERLFAINVFGPFRVIRAALPHLRQQGSGHIVNITSIGGRAPGAGAGLYSATKYALEGLSASLAQEVAPLGLSVTAVAPGAFRTDFLSNHSLSRSEAASQAYDETAGRMVGAFEKMDGNQLGDPAKGAQAILAAVDAKTPPLHLLLGSDALKRARTKLQAMSEEIDAWAPVTAGTDYPA